MTREQANTITRGMSVSFGGTVHTVESISVKGMAAPYFRLSDGQKTSYQVCTLADRYCMYCALPSRMNGQAECLPSVIAHVFVSGARSTGPYSKRHPLDVA